MSTANEVGTHEIRPNFRVRNKLTELSLEDVEEDCIEYEEDVHVTEAGLKAREDKF